MRTLRSHHFLGVRIDDITYQEALDQAGIMMHEPRLHHVVTVNAEFVMTARQHAAFRQVIEKADLALPDGAGALLAGQLTGRPLRQRVTGVDLVTGLAELAAKHNWRLYLLGAAPGVAEQAAANLIKRFPGLVIAGSYAGSPAEEEATVIIDHIRQSQADILLVAYGAPQQDLWIARHQAQLPVRLAMGVGGSFDFIAGRIKRAPQIMQRFGLEWAWRLLRQPWRAKRMLALPKFMILTLLERTKS